MKVTAVSNSTPIIGLASLNQLDLLNQLFGKVYVTRQVYNEVVGAAGSKCGANELRKQI